MHSLFWKIFLTLWLSIVGFSAAIGWLNDKLARQQWAEEPANTFSRGLVRISQRAQQALLSEGRTGLRNELLTIPRMTRSHIYIVDADGRELLRILRRHGAASTVALSFEGDGAGQQSLALGDEVYEWAGFFKLFD